MKYPPMTHEFIEHSPNRIVLDIAHDRAQSWSRAVDPKAMKVVKTAIHGGTWALVDTQYGRSDDDGRCASRYYYERQTP